MNDKGDLLPAGEPLDVRLRIAQRDGRVILNFGEPVELVSNSPAGARALAVALLKFAAEAEKRAKPAKRGKKVSS